MSKTILITGLNGQLGQHLVKYFQDNYPEFKTVGTVRHKSYDKQPRIFDETKVITEILDLSDSNSIESVVKKHKPDYLFNTAANAFVGDSWLLAEQHMSINCMGVLKILEAIKNYSPNTRFLNLGTSEELGCTLEDSPNGAQDEQTKISPKSPYACSKAAARYLVDCYRNSYNLYAIQPWTFNFESELRGEKYLTRKVTRGVSRIYHAMKNDINFAPIELGNLNSSRSWQHAEDVSDGLWKIINQQGEPKDWKPYVLSENDTHTIREFVEKAFFCAGIKGRWHNPLPEKPLMEEFILCEENGLATKKKITLVKVNPEFFRLHDVSFLYGNSNKARQELGWRPKVAFDDLVWRMVNWDINNP